MVPIEDNAGDVVGKAQRGLGFTNEALARQAGVTVGQLRAIRAGEFHEEVLRKVAPVLGLGAGALVGLARGVWRPPQPGPIAGFRAFTSAHGDMLVNAYLVWDAASGNAVLFDTGADAAPVLAALKELRLALELVLLTHAHVDHVVELPKILAATRARAWINAREADEEDFPSDAETFATGQSFVLGPIRIETLLTHGHSAGQTTYLVRGLPRLVAIVGDAVFAGSMGGGFVSYADQLRSNREHILTLPGDTVLAPGHGPLTTVAEELRHNPFFAA